MILCVCGHEASCHYVSVVDYGPTSINKLLGDTNCSWPGCECALFKLKPEPPAPSPKTLRDEFAMAAMSGLLQWFGNTDMSETPKRAKICYQVADAMMKEREKKNET
jgi:hypothetical protein